MPAPSLQGMPGHARSRAAVAPRSHAGRATSEHVARRRSRCTKTPGTSGAWSIVTSTMPTATFTTWPQRPGSGKPARPGVGGRAARRRGGVDGAAVRLSPARACLLCSWDLASTHAPAPPSAPLHQTPGSVALRRSTRHTATGRLCSPAPFSRARSAWAPFGPGTTPPTGTTWPSPSPCCSVSTLRGCQTRVCSEQFWLSCAFAGAA